jgi:hypothetical protein
VRNVEVFSLDDVSACSDVIRTLGRGRATMTEAAADIVRYLYGELGTDGDDHACTLVRLYKTHPFGGLPVELREYASDAAGRDFDADVRCLTLLATAGEEPEWNDPRLSVGHRTIPLPSEEIVRRLPMVAQLITQVGLDVGTVVRPAGAPLVELAQRTYDVFHVPVAAGSPYIPAQDFVERYGVESALGFGGMLHTGDFYSVVLFTKVPVSVEVARTIRILALAVRIPLMRFLLRDVFTTASRR